uniref:Uncharacterized protein n=1 Tax=Proboscia inermis TaxID=420281 RepID=A0A7S0CE55_9STRA|mmetsp:Transcript_43047/g.43670  ORF Transcript_43047/g.43670 Transcript_43047/m.43670 type:complete len:129 (+) Transcript_43047:286-672(+)
MEEMKNYVGARLWSRQAESDVVCLVAATKSAQGELYYCASSIPQISSNTFKPDSIAAFSDAFRLLMLLILQQGVDFDNNATEILIRCGKDLGKACNFAQQTPLINIFDEQGRLVDPGMFLDFAYIFGL